MPKIITGLQGRLILYLAVALVVLLGAFGLLSLQTINKAQSQAFSQQLLLADAMAKGVENQFARVATDVAAYLSSQPSPYLKPESLSSLLEYLGHEESMGYFRIRSIRMVDGNGSVLAAAPPDTSTLRDTLPSDALLQRALDRGAYVVGASRLPTNAGGAFAAVIVPLLSDGSSPATALIVDTVGVTAIQFFSFTGMAESAQGQEEKSTYEVEVLSPVGIVLTTSMGPRNLGKTGFHYLVMKDYMEAGRAGAIVHRPGNGRPPHIVAGMPIGDLPFYLVSEDPRGLLLDWPQQLRDQAILLGVVAVLVILSVGWVMGRQIVQPLRALRVATSRIKEGDLETPVRARAQGEVGQLIAEVEAMRARLHDTVSRLDRLTRSLTDQVKERTDRLQTVLRRLMNAQEEERRRVARDLHDETAQGLSALGVILDEAALNAEDGEPVLDSIRGARKQVNRLVEETRRLVYALRPSVLDDAGLVPALRWCAEAYLEARGVQVSFQVHRPDVRFPEPVEVALFRVGQEAMSNIGRHAEATHAWISLERQKDWATLTVRDDGIGFNPAAVMRQAGSTRNQGLGLEGMQERIGLLGGKVDLLSVPGEGTTVIAHVPLSSVE